MSRPAAERVVVVGAGAAGLLAAVLLARAGRRVLVVDRDPAAADPPAAPAEPRAGVPQARHSHAFLARFRGLLAARAPDLLDALLAAGAREIRLTETAPPQIRAGLAAARADGAGPVPRWASGDPAELVVLGARRALVDAVLRAAALAEPGVTLRAGLGVPAVVTAPGGAAGPAGAGQVPWVRGVRLDDGSTVEADLVVDAGGRRSPMRELLAAAGAPPPPELAVPCGITYYSRFYARAGDRALATALNRGHTVGASFDRYSCLVFPADNDTFSVTFGVLPEDAELRVLRHDAAFDAAVRSIDPVARWLEDGPAGPVTPLGPVAAMAGLSNRFRPWVTDGRPAALGALSIGDAALITNPAHTRGTTLAALAAAWLVDAVTATDDPGERALRLDSTLRAEGLPWLRDSCEQDAARLARWRPAEPEPAPSAPPAPTSSAPAPRAADAASRERVTNGEAFLASGRDPLVWHAFTRLQNLLATPADLLADPAFVARVRAVQASGWRPDPVPGPSRDELLATAHAALAPAGGAPAVGPAR
ncbi:FAD-dependent monooxygenase [Frankia sp. CNm7]|uniref:FAD-dependent monooxygenase n=1 Tax=Frankia nepalensis TaxID=1836974 RepID=UPI0019332889|nr:FAD-dependent monooxygenase [Frankia nepalensis]MBL7522702.1 FAD-dependent monooxygenase [Frankia nepalensis]